MRASLASCSSEARGWQGKGAAARLANGWPGTSMYRGTAAGTPPPLAALLCEPPRTAAAPARSGGPGSAFCIFVVRKLF